MYKIDDFLSEGLNNGLNTYFICDAAQVSQKIEKYLKFLRSTQNNVEVISIFTGTEWGNAPLECSPLLFDLKNVLHSNEYYLIEDLLNTSESMHVVQTKLTLVDFIKKIKKFLKAKIKNNEFLFRWYDPRILKISNTLFTEGQNKDFYDEIFSWKIFVRSKHSHFNITVINMDSKL